MVTAADHALHYKISNFTCTQDVLHYFRFVFLYLACCNFKFANTYIVRNDVCHMIAYVVTNYQAIRYAWVVTKNDVRAVHSSSSFYKSIFT